MVNTETNETTKTVKGGTITKYGKDFKFNILNIVYPDCKAYRYNRAYDAERPITIGKVDFTHKEAVVKDLGLRGVQLLGKKVSSNRMAVCINGRAIGISWKRERLNPLSTRMGGPDEESIVNITSNAGVLKTYSIGYHGKVESVELQVLNGAYGLKVNHYTEEPGLSTRGNSIISL